MSRDAFLEAYERWRKTQALVENLSGLSFQQQLLALSIRNKAWDDYCAARDGKLPSNVTPIRKAKPV